MEAAGKHVNVVEMVRCCQWKYWMGEAELEGRLAGDWMVHPSGCSGQDSHVVMAPGEGFWGFGQGAFL